MRVIGALLTANDATAQVRLTRREIGSGHGWHLERSHVMAERLQAEAPAWVHRIPTDDRSVEDVAGDVLALVTWV